MKQFFYLAVICAVTFTACTEPFKKGDKGMEYKIIKGDGKGPKLNTGMFLELHITEVYKGTKDSILNNSREIMPRIIPFDSSSTPPAYFKILKGVQMGDSLVVRILVDSVYAGMQQPMPPFMKKGKMLYTYIKVLGVLENAKQADSANKAELKVAKPIIRKKQMEAIEKDLATNKAQLDIDKKMIRDYLAKNNIQATETKWGTFVAIHQPGTGANVTLDDVAVVNYTGRSLDSGKVFDSNTDPKFGHVQPFKVQMTQIGNVILGWSDALLQLKKGTKATVYIPSSLGYGAQGNQGIAPNMNMIFDIDVLDIISEEQAEVQLQAERAASERKMDSMRNAQSAQPQK